MSQDDFRKTTIVLPANLKFALKAVAAKERRYIQNIAAELFNDYIKERHPDIYNEFILSNIDKNN